MTFRINRLYHLRKKSFWMENILLLIVIPIVVVLDLYRRGKPDFITVLAILVIFVLCCIWDLHRKPNKFTVSNGEVILWMYLKKHLPEGVTFNRRHWRYAKMFVTVCRVEKIEYNSSVEERIGTICLYGEIRTQSSSGEYVDPYQPVEFIELCGVKSFSEAIYQLKKAFPEAAYIRN